MKIKLNRRKRERDLEENDSYFGGGDKIVRDSSSSS